MKILLCAALLLSALVALSQGQACGRGPRAPTSRIIGGSPTPDYIPWQVVLYKNRFRRWYFICGGSLIHRQWIVTAAHCVVGARTSQILVRYGTKIRTSGPIARVRRIIRHPSYRGIRTGWANDIALIQLTRPVGFNSRVGSICMPRSAASAGSTVRITGFGRIDSGALPRPLIYVDVTVSTFTVCKRTYPWVDARRFICAGDNGQGACNGDSGGPMSYFRSNRWELQGIVSFGPRSCRVSTTRPNGYTRVVNYVRWIRSNCGRCI